MSAVLLTMLVTINLVTIGYFSIYAEIFYSNGTILQYRELQHLAQKKDDLIEIVLQPTYLDYHRT